MSSLSKHDNQRRPPRQVPRQDTRRSSPKHWKLAAILLGAVFLLAVALVYATRTQFKRDASAEVMKSVPPPSKAAATQPDAAYKENRSASLVAEGNEELAKGNLQAAIDKFQRALELTPGSEDVHYNLGIAYGRTGNSTNAEHHYLEALRLLHNYPEAHNNLGNLLMREGRLEEAEAHFNEALKILPEYAAAYNNLGILRKRQNRAEDAEAFFTKAVKADPNYWQARFNLATSYRARGELDKTKAELQEILRLNPSFEAAKQELDRLQSQSLPTLPK